MRRHRDSNAGLRRAVVADGDLCDRTTIRSWRSGEKEPRCVASCEILGRVEQRYRLPAGYFRQKLSHGARGAVGIVVRGVRPSERRRLAWYLPDDFDRRSIADQQEILEWVRRVIVSGATEYRRFQAAASRQRYALRFAAQPEGLSPQRASAAIPLAAPPALQEELAALVHFKTATLTDIGFSRQGVWGEETASQKTEHLSLLFGALAASPTSAVNGLGVPKEHLSFALLVVPAIWDWYVKWRERRRGFYTRWEVDMLCVAMALTRRETGWLRQTPELAKRLVPIAGLVDEHEVAAVQV